ncbi:UvrD-helicase domain-containing protein [Aquimarina algiphila]|uniref:UvrD-helicase domain-containing protein n=1 Tax=Aquimarina algiphila TaxID=2047982 RepID=UPI0014320009|nr:UvrD-helicase domain-containing protein [Aquimarina algiphila]
MPNGYQWQQRYVVLYSELFRLEIDRIGLSKEELTITNAFLNFHANGNEIRKRFNTQFIAKEKTEYQDFFNDIEGNSLDNQQRECIITDEDNNLVIAGAGSGKTTTIVGKVKYLINRYKTKPENILLISFTKASAKDLTERVNFRGIEVRTFHSLGNDIIRSVEKGKPSIYDSNQFRRHINGIFKKLQGQEEYLNDITNYFISYMKLDKSSFEFDSQEDYIEYMKDQDFKTYKQKVATYGDKETVNREIVKSMEECKIANFLFFNRVRYEYEYPYEHNTRDLDYRQYKPDFTLFNNEEKIYLEHFGIDREGNVPPFFADEGQSHEDARLHYNQGIEWKRKTHQAHNTSCIETYSYENSEGVLLDNLAKKLTEAGITVNPMTQQEKWKVINEVAIDEVRAMVDLFIQFLSLFKSNNYSLDDLIKKLNSKSGFEKVRNTLFLKLFIPIYKEYQIILNEKAEIDFSDMINRATDYILTGKYTTTYDYIIVDEFQDISQGRYQLLNALKNSNPACRLFCVGDDWQSIYRFTGSDSSLFNQFERYFGVTEISKIETTYRFKNPMIDISGNFITQNPSQIKKQLRSFTNDASTSLKVEYSKTDTSDDTEALKQAFLKYVIKTLLKLTKNQYSVEELAEKIKAFELDKEMQELQQKKFLILGRNNRDFNRLNFENHPAWKKVSENQIQLTFAKKYIFDFQFLTVHRSKGLQANVVFIVNCNSGRYGFPNEISDDPVMDLLLSHAEPYPNAEERRLFYVALTRAKERTVCIANVNHISKFINQLDKKPPEEIKRCPRCKKGNLKLRTGPYGNFYGCSNFSYGCRYIKKKKK